jgi:hypothetical protein
MSLGQSALVLVQRRVLNDTNVDEGILSVSFGLGRAGSKLSSEANVKALGVEICDAQNWT